MNAFKCPGCGASTSGNQKYCSECGHPLDKICENCGFSIRYIYAEKYKFCPECGGIMKYSK